MELTAKIKKSEDDDGFIGFIEEDLSVISQGDSLDECLYNLKKTYYKSIEKNRKENLKFIEDNYDIFSFDYNLIIKI